VIAVWFEKPTGTLVNLAHALTIQLHEMTETQLEQMRRAGRAGTAYLEATMAVHRTASLVQVELFVGSKEQCQTALDRIKAGLQTGLFHLKLNEHGKAVAI
jgi:phage-related minor tail protein